MITRSDKTSSGTIAVFEVFCFGKTTTTTVNLEGAFHQFKNKGGVQKKSFLCYG